MQTAQQTNRLDFLFAAGFEMMSRVPALSRYYMSEFQHSLTEFELTTPKTVARLACPSCGQIRLPGLSTHVAIEGQKRKKGKRPGNRIKTTCASCCHTSFYHGSYKHKLPTATAAAAAVVPTVTPVVIEKKKKNKGKKNSLKAMLNKSTQQKESTGNLADFLSFL
ncbi:hypothetical protein INT47_000084 [Mucor saturninus]|uniref:Uncharacterized protein n=1 Tax=Mucor saturninus TaxID=64648 RepID=A0A8H7RIJ9_9FUNG|nr:hypothetical protein INT47_000084 [Mucor saturninus]